MTCAVARAALPVGAWDRFVASHRDGWFFHSSAWLDYALAYAPGSVDYSQAFVRGDEIVATISSVIGQDGRWTNGGQLAVPLLADDDSAVEHDLFAPGLRVAWRPGFDVDDVPVPTNGVLSRESTYVVDLWDGDEVAHWRRLRKSYRSLIHQAESRYEIIVLSRRDEARRCVVEIAQAVHLEDAGRRTRSEQTWVLMGEWAADGRGVVALAWEKDPRRCIGMAYAVRWKEWAYWLSGATLVRNIQHALQWHLIKALMCDGETRYYEVGHAATKAETISDEKARNISFFKAGFGGTRWVVPVVEATS